jgi:monoterpene epsilon-lactone hydrolase
MSSGDDGRNSVGREVARFIPVPTSVSEQAQQFLSMDMFGASGQRVAPRDVAGWRTLIKETDELIVAVMGAQVENLRLSVQSRTVGGVPVFVIAPEGVNEDAAQSIFLDIHGGSLVMGGGKACEVMARRMAAQVQMQTWPSITGCLPTIPIRPRSMTSSPSTEVCSVFGPLSRSW